LLDLRAESPADQSAVDVEVRAIEAIVDQVEWVLSAPASATIHTDIKPGPVVNSGWYGGSRSLDDKVRRLRG
jgi:hypothetical protein